MTAITRNLPWFVKDLGVAIVSQVRAFYSDDLAEIELPIFQKCYESLVENLDIGDVECLKYSLSKGLGFGIVLGGSIMKVPQLLLSGYK